MLELDNTKMQAMLLYGFEFDYERLEDYVNALPNKEAVWAQIAKIKYNGVPNEDQVISLVQTEYDYMGYFGLLVSVVNYDSINEIDQEDLDGMEEYMFELMKLSEIPIELIQFCRELKQVCTLYFRII